MVQPRVGRRRIIASSSDEDSEGGNVEEQKNIPKARTILDEGSRVQVLNNQRHLPDRNRPKALASISSQATTPSPTPTPDSTPKKKNAKALPKDVTKKSTAKTLYSFFNTATQKIQQRSQSPERQHSEVGGNPGDAIQDDSSDMDTVQKEPSSQPPSIVQNNRKRFFSKLDDSVSNKPQFASSLPSQKFLKALDGSKAVPAPTPKPVHDIAELRPWAEEYAPSKLEELVIHKKKVSDVRQWLLAALAGQDYKRLLVLKGPAGSGKTITLTLLAKALGFEIVEWKNPGSSDFSDDYISISSQFDDFLGRGRHFGSLDFSTTEGIVDSSDLKVKDVPTYENHINLIEEFPYTLLRATSALQTFRSTLLQCLAADIHRPTNGRSATPIVLIVSESTLSSNSSSSENFTVHRLLGPEVLHHPSTMMIEFNSVAPTFISKALNVVLQKHRKKTGIQISPDQDAIRKISEIGDVRNAVATLEFISKFAGSMPTGLGAMAKSRSHGSKAKATHHSTQAASTSVASLSIVGLRESTLGLFHAIGKVVYNKRSIPNAAQSTQPANFMSAESQLSAHISHHARPLPSEVDITTLIDETGTDTSTFLSGLHENYALSCSDPSGNSETTLDTLNACLDVLGDADILLNPVFASRSGVSEGVRQEEIAFETGVRGLLFSLPHPVKRQPYPGKSKADAHRMFYPTGLKIWRKKEEISGLLDLFVERAMDGTLLGGLRLSRAYGDAGSINRTGKMAWSIEGSTEAGVDRWRRNTVEDNPGTGDADEAASQPYLAMGSGHSARHEMLLERLPYLTRILAGAPSPVTQGFQKQIEQVTLFTGIGVLQDDEEDEGTSTTNGTGTAIVSKGGSIAKTAGLDRTRKSNEEEQLDVKGLVLSDDDIEDE